MNIYDMVEGRNYLIGDSLGYDVVKCLGQEVMDLGEGQLVNVVRYKRLEDGVEDFVFETPGFASTTYVEPR
jgi:hypothetical protein